MFYWLHFPEEYTHLYLSECPPNPLLPHSSTIPGDYIVDTVIEYHCQPEYVAVGNNTIQCQKDQTWTKLEYACLCKYHSVSLQDIKLSFYFEQWNGCNLVQLINLKFEIQIRYLELDGTV